MSESTFIPSDDPLHIKENYYETSHETLMPQVLDTERDGAMT